MALYSSLSGFPIKSSKSWGPVTIRSLKFPAVLGGVHLVLTAERAVLSGGQSNIRDTRGSVHAVPVAEILTSCNLIQAFLLQYILTHVFGDATFPLVTLETLEIKGD